MTCTLKRTIMYQYSYAYAYVYRKKQEGRARCLMNVGSVQESPQHVQSRTPSHDSVKETRPTPLCASPGQGGTPCTLYHRGESRRSAEDAGPGFLRFSKVGRRGHLRCVARALGQYTAWSHAAPQCDSRRKGGNRDLQPQRCRTVTFNCAVCVYSS